MTQAIIHRPPQKGKPLAGEVLREAAGLCREAIERGELRPIRDVLLKLGMDPLACHRIVMKVSESPQSQEAVRGLKRMAEEVDPACTADGALERYLIANSATLIADRIAGLPVCEPVKGLYPGEFRFFAQPEAGRRGMFAVGQYRFAEMCKVVSLRRFPAGQLQWEISGVGKRLLARISPRELPRVLYSIFTRLKGLSPCFCTHLNGRRKNFRVLLESAQNKAYYRIAKSMELQPRMRGLVTASWLYSPATHEVSPHLSWTNKPILESGGLIVDAGTDDPENGALVGSAERRELWAQGRFVPRMAAVIWPRAALLRWAEQHPEFGEGSWTH